MDLSRQDFLKTSGRTFTETALGGLAGVGASLAPTLAQAQELRIKHAKATPSVCPYCSVGCLLSRHSNAATGVRRRKDPR